MAPRWYSEDMLRTCDPSDAHPLKDVDKDVSTRLPCVGWCHENSRVSIVNQGMTWEEFLVMAECNGAGIQGFRADDPSVTEVSTRAASHAPAVHC